MDETKRYTRIVNLDPGPGSAFQDARFPLSGQRIATAMPEMALGALGAVNDAAYVLSASFSSAPHPAPKPQWVIMLRGAIEVVVTDGTRRVFGPGDLLLAEDTDGPGHITNGVGDGPFEALVLPVR